MFPARHAEQSGRISMTGLVQAAASFESRDARLWCGIRSRCSMRASMAARQALPANMILAPRRLTGPAWIHASASPAAARTIQAAHMTCSVSSATHTGGRSHATHARSHPNTPARRHILAAKPPAELRRQERAPRRLAVVHKPGLHRPAVPCTPVSVLIRNTPLDRRVCFRWKRQRNSLSYFFQNLAVVICLGLLSQAPLAFEVATQSCRWPQNAYRFLVH